MIGNTRVLDERLGVITGQLNDLITQVERLIQDNAHRAQDQKEYTDRFENLNNSIEEKKSDIATIKQQISDALSRRENARIFLKGLKELPPTVEQFDIPSWHALVECIKIMPDKNIIFHLRNGCEEVIPLAEVQ